MMRDALTAAVVAQDGGAVVVLADIATVLLAGLVLGRCMRRLRQPIVIGEIVAGIALGPSVLGRLPHCSPQTRMSCCRAWPRSGW